MNDAIKNGKGILLGIGITFLRIFLSTAIQLSIKEFLKILTAAFFLTPYFSKNE